MVNPEVVCHPSIAKTTVMHANSLPPYVIVMLDLTGQMIIWGASTGLMKVVFCYALPT
jgi:hypothetical protein